MEQGGTSLMFPLPGNPEIQVICQATGEIPYENQAPYANCQFQSSKP